MVVEVKYRHWDLQVENHFNRHQLCFCQTVEDWCKVLALTPQKDMSLQREIQYKRMAVMYWASRWTGLIFCQLYPTKVHCARFCLACKFLGWLITFLAVLRVFQRKDWFQTSESLQCESWLAILLPFLFQENLPMLKFEHVDALSMMVAKDELCLMFHLFIEALQVLSWIYELDKGLAYLCVALKSMSSRNGFAGARRKLASICSSMKLSKICI